MIDIYENYAAPLSKETLCRWHKMITNGRYDLVDIGWYRTHADPMQVVSGAIGRPVVHFEAPPSRQVAGEMDSFIHWFNSTKRDQENNLLALVRSSVAHLYFESIHPFEDGNGRIGRGISEKALSQSLERPILLTLSRVIEQDKKGYYSALEHNNKDLEIEDWIHYFCQLVLKAQDYSQSLINFTIAKATFYRHFEHKFNLRQKKVVERIFKEGPSGFSGGLSARNYMTISGAPSATATRDLTKMVEMGAFGKTGAMKSTRYYLNLLPAGL